MTTSTTVTVIREAVLTALGLMAKFTQGPMFLPEMKMVRLFTDGALLKLVAVSQEGRLALTVGADVKGRLDTLIPIEPLEAVVKVAPVGATLKLTPDGKSALRVEYPRNRSRLVGLATADSSGRHREEWPALRTGSAEAARTAELSADTLRATLPMVAFAAATDESRPILQSVYLSVADGQAELAATNGFHIMLRRIPATHSEAWSAVIPLRTAHVLTALLNTLESDQDTLTLSRTELALVVEYGPAILWAQMVEGAYPDYRRVVPVGDLPIRARVPQSDLRRLANATVIVNQKEAAIQIRPGLAAMYAEDATCGDVHPVCAATSQDTFTTFINPKWIGAAIKAMPPGDLTLSASKPHAPLMLSPCPDTLYLLMPMHTGHRLPAIPEPALDLFATVEQAAQPNGDEGERVVTDSELFAAAEATYCADKIAAGRIKKPFTYKGHLWVNTGARGDFIECTRVVPSAEWPGPVTTYREKTQPAREHHTEFSYAGILVRQGRNEYVLTDDELLVANDKTRSEADRDH